MAPLQDSDVGVNLTTTWEEQWRLLDDGREAVCLSVDLICERCSLHYGSTSPNIGCFFTPLKHVRILRIFFYSRTTIGYYSSTL